MGKIQPLWTKRAVHRGTVPTPLNGVALPLAPAGSGFAFRFGGISGRSGRGKFNRPGRFLEVKNE